MKYIKTTEELVHHITEALSKLEELLNVWRESEHKTADLLATWIKQYVDLLKIEKAGTGYPAIRYRHGSIVLVNFGFRIGSELGGLHYAVVLDVTSYKSARTITVLPLSSIKSNTQCNRYKVRLNDGLHQSLQNKELYLNGQVEELLLNINEAETKLAALLSATDSSETKSQQMQISNDIASTRSDVDKLLKKAADIRKYLPSMSTGTCALIGQITTVSTLRISRPLKNTDIFFNLSLSEQDLSLIQSAVQKLYIYTAENSEESN